VKLADTAETHTWGPAHSLQVAQVASFPCLILRFTLLISFLNDTVCFGPRFLEPVGWYELQHRRH
jgi:hypothetical protein